MTPELLSAYFSRIANAPGATQYLRLFIIDAAVQGRLGSSKNGLGTASWQSMKLADCATVINGRAYQQAELLSAGVPVIRIQNLNGGQSWYYSDLQLGPEKYAEPGDLLYAWSGTFGPYIWNGPRGIFHYHIWKLCLSEQADKRFIFYLLQHLTSKIKAEAHGLMLPHMTKKKMEDWPVMLPPLAEQHRIVAKVDELMALCDRLEAAQAERESRRDRLAAASLQRLNQPADAPAFREHARFHLSHLQRLTTRPEQIKQLRQTILNMAVHGQLVHQDPNDEPASLLLTRITGDTNAYCQKRGVPTPKPEPFDEEAVAYVVPPNWVWTRLCTLFRVVTDGDHQPPPKSEGGVAFLTIGNITTGQIDFSHCRFVPQEYFDSIAEYRKPTHGDILYTIVGATYGRPALVETDRSFCVQRHIAILKPSGQIDVRFLFFLLASPLVYEQATRSTTGTAQPTIPLRPLRNFLVPLPPLAEQHRIVAKVDELMALCDRLEAQLTTTQTQSRRLLEAVLHEALAGA